jgi:hypothetical protein
MEDPSIGSVEIEAALKFCTAIARFGADTISELNEKGVCNHLSQAFELSATCQELVFELMGILSIWEARFVNWEEVLVETPVDVKRAAVVYAERRLRTVHVATPGILPLLRDFLMAAACDPRLCPDRLRELANSELETVTEFLADEDTAKEIRSHLAEIAGDGVGEYAIIAQLIAEAIGEQAEEGAVELFQRQVGQVEEMVNPELELAREEALGDRMEDLERRGMDQDYSGGNPFPG